jgi:hypothetical protein
MMKYQSNIHTEGDGSQCGYKRIEFMDGEAVDGFALVCMNAASLVPHNRTSQSNRDAQLVFDFVFIAACADARFT